jgi:hypothetical protein
MKHVQKINNEIDQWCQAGRSDPDDVIPCSSPAQLFRNCVRKDIVGGRRCLRYSSNDRKE